MNPDTHLREAAMATDFEIDGTLLGYYPLAGGDVTQLHVGRSVEGSLREFFITCANAALSSPLKLGSSIHVRGRALMLSSDIADDGALEIRPTFVGISVTR